MGAFSLIVVINLLNRCDMTSSGETDEHSSPSTSKLMQCTEEGCEETFRKKTQLRHHLSEKHKETVLLKSYECPSCKKCFATNQRLKRHQETHNGYKCESCDITHTTWSELRKHRAIHHRTLSVKCECCHAKFESKTTLKEHMSTCPEKSKLICKICRKQFSKVENLKKHLKTVHHCQRDYFCVNCNKEFLHAHNVWNHLAVCYANTDDSFAQQSTMLTSESLKDMIDSALKKQSTPGQQESFEYECADCSKKFKYRRSLWRHQRQNCKFPADKEHESELESATTSASVLGNLELGFGSRPRRRPIFEVEDGYLDDWMTSPVVKIVKMSQERSEGAMDERSLSSDCERGDLEEHTRFPVSNGTRGAQIGFQPPQNGKPSSRSSGNRMEPHAAPILTPDESPAAKLGKSSLVQKGFAMTTSTESTERPMACAGATSANHAVIRTSQNELQKAL